jgi:hypothetical protein
MIPGLSVIFYNYIGIKNANPPQGVALFGMIQTPMGVGPPISDSGVKKQWKMEFLQGCSMKLDNLSGRRII